MNWYELSQTQSYVPNFKLDIPKKEYSDIFEELEDCSDELCIRKVSQKWGYKVNSIKLDNEEVILTIRKDNKIFVIDDVSFPVFITQASEWIEGLSDLRISQYIQVGDFNNQFWENVNDNDKLYHGTFKSRVESILRYGLEPRSETRGITNKFDGSGVYTSREKYAPFLSYDTVLEIDVGRMKRNGFTPIVRREGPIDKAELKNALANRIGLDDYFDELLSADGLSENTIIFKSKIPVEYIKITE